MERRVDEPDDDRQALHGPQDSLEVGALKREQLGQETLPLLGRLAQDHRLHDGEALLLHEHVLGPAEADALGAKLPRLHGVVGVVAVGPDLEPADPIGPAEQSLEVGRRLGLDGADLALVDVARCAVDRYLIALLDRRPVG